MDTSRATPLVSMGHLWNLNILSVQSAKFSGSHILSVSFFNALKLRGCSSCGLVIAYMFRQTCIFFLSHSPCFVYIISVSTCLSVENGKYIVLNDLKWPVKAPTLYLCYVEGMCCLVVSGWFWLWAAHLQTLRQIFPRWPEALLHGGIWHRCCHLYQSEYLSL